MSEKKTTWKFSEAEIRIIHNSLAFSLSVATSSITNPKYTELYNRFDTAIKGWDQRDKK